MKTNYLIDILARKKRDVEFFLDVLNREPDHPFNRLAQAGREPSTTFSQALKSPELAVIAEIKRKSPSKGDLNPIADPIALARQYCLGGAAAISILTDVDFFGGCLSELNVISQMMPGAFPRVATLRKDFIIHPLQLAEAACAGAHAVLLIVSVIGNELKFFIDQAKHLGLEALVEIHNHHELEIALEAEAPIIGINHRNLHTFEMDLTLSETLRPFIPDSVLTVAESGIHTPEQAKNMRDLGFDAILVGEALVRSPDPRRVIMQMRGALPC